MNRTPRSRTRRALLADLVLPLAIALLAVLAFASVLPGEFVAWDDDKNFLTNPDYRGLGLAQLRWMWTTFHLGHYIPLSWMSLGLDYTIWGMDATGYHLTNLLLHASASVMVYVIARRLITPRGGIRDGGERDAPWIPLAAAVGALFFAVHPLRAESVAWITERRDVLSETFSLLSLYGFLRYTDGGDGRWRWYGGSLALFVCGVLSKGTVLTLPALLLVLNIFPLRRLGGPRSWWTRESRGVLLELVPFGVVAAATSVLSLVALPEVPQLPPAGKVAVSLYSLAFYLWKTVLPTNLAPLYTLPRDLDPFALRYIIAGATVLAISALALTLRRRAPALLAGWLAYVLALFPMLGFHQNGPQIAADRYTYHAAPVLSILLAAALAIAFRSRVRSAALAAAGAVLLTLGVLTWQQSKIWLDSSSLWAQVIRVDTSGWIGENNWGNVLMANEQFAEAEQHFKLAGTRNPEYAEAFNNLGVSRLQQARPADAIEPLRRALALNATYDEAEVNLGGAYAQLGDHGQAIEAYRSALAMNPRNTAARINWGNALLRLERPGEAIPLYESALALEPGNAAAIANLNVARRMAAELSARP